MQNLIDTLKKIENILCSLETITNQEYKNLSDFNNNENILDFMKKKVLLKKYSKLNEDRILFEKEYGIFLPYKNHYILYKNWTKIVKKCYLLKKLNIRNKILINKKFYLNQKFLELLPNYTASVSYDAEGNLQN
ncbi:flagellar export chaperone FlgN [Buchnera aphidicola]|uniref:Flagellar biosynthesis protein FlgN n=1 Tax=Buchnera aphidicola (Artemisaphis artemisicola) TaxID=1241836 RepID=A0A4D6XT88_9GAMM|nr:flagellar export chaperone FlgN [Buchnera aphidicola]QCI16005.1 flagellar biosynthesis protein FlgN [Buchnera aphidicola (Artemisaphis artemisicola)]